MYSGLQCRERARSVSQLVLEYLDTSSFEKKEFGNANVNQAIESTYVIRRVQLHNRELVEGQSPWSIRQTGVYQRLIYDSNWSDLTSSTNKYSKSTFLLIAPSESIESQISECMERVNSHGGDALSPWIVHLLLIAESQEGWMDYMAWLEKGLKQQASSTLTSGVIYVSKYKIRLI